MRGRGRAAMVIGVALVLLASAGCTDNDDEDLPTADPDRVPRAFVDGADGGWGLVGATARALVGLGGQPADDDIFGQVFDLETGEVTDIRPPPSDGEDEIQLIDATFGDDHLTVAGYQPPDGEAPPDSGTPFTLDLVTFRLDPEDGSWSRLSLPRALTVVGPGAVDLAPVGSDGAAMTVSAFDGGDPVMLTTTRDGWRSIGTVPWTSGQTCATDTEWWTVELERTEAMATATDLADGSTRSVALPPLAGPAGPAVFLGCSSTTAALGVVNGIVSALDVYTAPDGGDWVLHEEVQPNLVLGQEVRDGGAVGPLFRGSAVEPGAAPAAIDESVDASVVVAADGTPAAVDLGAAEALAIWRGRGADLLVIDPREDADADGRVAFRTITVP